MDTDSEWEKWGRQDPYFAVLTNDRFHLSKIDDESRAAFFAQGEEDVARAMSICRNRIDAGFSPRRILDFGCGVGRTAVAFASLAGEVVGIDVSAAMLEEARANLTRFGVENVRLARIEGLDLPVTGRFDLVYSFIVLQHVRPKNGLVLFRQLVDAVAPGGLGLIQLTYSHKDFAGDNGVAKEAPRWKRLERRRRRLLRRIRGKVSRPVMEMNFYDLNQVFFCLQMAGAADAQVEFTDHAGFFGMYVCFSKPSQPSQLPQPGSAA
jgi:SAM-dependent methyltransferase